MQEVVDLTIEPHEIVDLTGETPQVPLRLMDLRAAIKTLAMARIRGSFEDLKAGHRELLKMADRIVEAAPCLPVDERFASVLGRLHQNGEYAISIFPKKVDVSNYGYNESDTKLAEYRSDPEGYALRRAKLRSKRKKAHASFRNVANPSREIGPIAYFYHSISFRLPLISAASLLKHITAEVPKNPRRTISCSRHSMRLSQSVFVVSSLAAACEAFRFTVWLGDKCTISGTGTKPSDQELLVIPQTAGDDGCMVRVLAKSIDHPCRHELTQSAPSQKYELMEYGYDQSLLIRPEAQDAPDKYLAFFPTQDCSGDPLLISPPASVLRERPVAGCSNYAAAGITTMSPKTTITTLNAGTTVPRLPTTRRYTFYYTFDKQRQTVMATPRSIFSRKRDLVYLIFFIIHVPIVFCVDLAPLYPASLKPEFITTLREWYISTYADRFFTQPPAWFNFYMYMELVYHVPLSVWAIGALIRDDPRVPVHLLVYAVQTALTTATCIADYMSWSDYLNSQKIELGKLYVPYLALSVFMAVDMLGRLHAVVGERKVVRDKKSQ
ncbi:hypothetical protein Q7P35_005232 [Cladosporium inversicolor]